MEVLQSTGAGDWNRTSDLRFTKPLLYQLSYAGFGRDLRNLHGFWGRLKRTFSTLQV
jgi:hypothetical protein